MLEKDNKDKTEFDNSVMFNLYKDPFNEKYNDILVRYINYLSEMKKMYEESSSTETNLGLQEKKEELIKNVELFNLYSRIHPKAGNILKDVDGEVLINFKKNEPIEMTVISLDIRKSTELMLKSHSPNNFSKFISGLTEGLKNIITNNFGIFNKFTGDGILAYFPIFYSGIDSILNCCLVSQECHQFFNNYYLENYDKFLVALDTGLGIGIDHGYTQIVKINNEQAIVGSPVVYACRLAGAPANKTYLNISAYKKIINYGISLKKDKMKLKNNETIIIYELDNNIEENIRVPDWAKGKI